MTIENLRVIPNHMGVFANVCDLESIPKLDWNCGYILVFSCLVFVQSLFSLDLNVYECICECECECICVLYMYKDE